MIQGKSSSQAAVAVLFLTAAAVCAGVLGGSEPMPDTKGPAKKQLRTLPPPPKEGRFEMSYDRRWPARPGQPEVCLWADDMDDGPFDYPLTIKVRLPATWNNMTARQGGKSAAARVVEHDGGRFALVQAVPDRGEVAIVESVCSR